MDYNYFSQGRRSLWRLFSSFGTSSDKRKKASRWSSGNCLNWFKHLIIEDIEVIIEDDFDPCQLSSTLSITKMIDDVLMAPREVLLCFLLSQLTRGWVQRSCLTPSSRTSSSSSSLLSHHRCEVTWYLENHYQSHGNVAFWPGSQWRNSQGECCPGSTHHPPKSDSQQILIPS